LTRLSRFMPFAPQQILGVLGRLGSQMAEDEKAKPRFLVELVLVIVSSLCVFLLLPSLAWTYTILPLAYLLVERRVRRPPIEGLGIKLRGLGADLKANLSVIILVAVVIQFLVVVGGYWLWPPLFLRLESRVAYLRAYYGTFAPFVMFLPLVALSTFLEELAFRGFVQERVGWFINRHAALLIGAILLGFFHYSPGALPVVAADLFFVFLGSSLYGLIYLRSRSVLAAWIAHLSSDLIGLALLGILSY